jgi:hypothetical protein
MIYRQDKGGLNWKNLSGKRDSNPRPSAWEADALPLSYSRLYFIFSLSYILLTFHQDSNADANGQHHDNFSRKICHDPRPSAWEADALTHELLPLVFINN